MKPITAFILLMMVMPTSNAQKLNKEFPYSIRLEQAAIDSFPALQSFSIATAQGKWLMIGGRTDGLHRKQPWATFDEAGQNKFIYVADPVNNKVWKTSLQNLPVSVIEQFQSTNMGFCQMDNRLVLTGGYGYSQSNDEHITFPYLTVIQVNEMINAIINDQPIADFITQVKDERMAITGGRLAHLKDTLILAGGQRFDGRYNPMGPDHGPGFTQVYSNEIRKFTLNFSDKMVAVKNYNAIRDSINLHRRDYNLVPQVFNKSELGFTMFSGVFKYNVDLPYTNFVDIASGSYVLNNDFEQKLNHYHSAVMPFYSKNTNAMTAVFFGGIAQYSPNKNGKVKSNTNVPFTKTISVIIRKEASVKEFSLPLEMPGYLGAAAEFVYNPDANMYLEGIIDADAFSNKEILVGYIVGGINSTDKNIFWINSGKESSASGEIIKVYIKSIR